MPLGRRRFQDNQGTSPMAGAIGQMPGSSGYMNQTFPMRGLLGKFMQGMSGLNPGMPLGRPMFMPQGGNPLFRPPGLERLMNKFGGVGQSGYPQQGYPQPQPTYQEPGMQQPTMGMGQHGMMQQQVPLGQQGCFPQPGMVQQQSYFQQPEQQGFLEQAFEPESKKGIKAFLSKFFGKK